ncbi:TetR/AcrR family transcriptional regulator [Planctomycetota bacterium]
MSGIKRSSSPHRLSPQPTPRIARSEHTRIEILNAALDFIWSRPFHDMTVNSLMASTKVSRSAFYQYFKDLHAVMETLLGTLQDEIFNIATPWLTGVGDPVALMHETLTGLVQVGYQRGPIYRAFVDAAATNKRFEKDWNQFLGRFDDAASARIEADQEQDLIPHFDARPVAISLNRLDAYTLIQAFGQRPRRQPEPVLEALARVWISTLYGSEWVGKKSSSFVRK